MTYFPDSEWQSINPEKAGFDERLNQAMSTAELLEIDAPGYSRWFSYGILGCLKKQ